MWSLYISIAGLVLFGGLALAFGFSRSRLARELGEVTRARDNLRERLAEQASMVELLLESDPPLDDLARMSEDAAAVASASGRGLSEVESRAIDRILRLDPARAPGAGEG